MTKLKDKYEEQFRYILKAKSVKTEWQHIPKDYEIMLEGLELLYNKYKKAGD